MPRTVTTRHVLNISAADYLDLRDDPEYSQYKASLQKQEIRVPRSPDVNTDAEGNEVRVRSVELHFSESPVPPFLRGLVNSLMGDELYLSVDERNYARRCSFHHPTTLTHRFPKAVGEVLSIESTEWVVALTPTQCVFHSRHEGERERSCPARLLAPPLSDSARSAVACTAWAMAGAIEQAVENGIQDGYGKTPALLDAYLRRKQGQGAAGESEGDAAKRAPAAAAKSGTAAAHRALEPARVSRAEGPLGRLLGTALSCTRARKPPRAVERCAECGRVGETTRRISVTVEDAKMARVFSMTTSESGAEPCSPWAGGARGRARTISIAISECPDAPDGTGRRVTIDESVAPAPRWAQCVAAFAPCVAPCAGVAFGQGHTRAFLTAAS